MLVPTVHIFSYNGKNFEIKFPTNRQYIEIQNSKSKLLSGKEALQSNVEDSSEEAILSILLIDSIAHLTTLCPEFISELLPETSKDKIIDINSILDLDLSSGMSLVRVYNNEFRPWYNSLLVSCFNPAGISETKS